MHSGSIPTDELAGGLDLRATLESGQTFRWRRVEHPEEESDAAEPDSTWYSIVADGDLVLARQRGDSLAWRATRDAEALLRRRLRLGDDLEAIFGAFPDEPALGRAREAFPGLRVVREPFFPCLVAFVCSARNSVERIADLQAALARAFGPSIDVEGETYHGFPGPDRLARATEADLGELGLGFRAPYVAECADLVASGEFDVEALRADPYREARERLQSLPGVGPKVADCVCLFALEHLQAVPVDRWTRRLIERRFPELDAGSDERTADAFRAHFGEYAGYAQTYCYHFERTRADA